MFPYLRSCSQADGPSTPDNNPTMQKRQRTAMEDNIHAALHILAAMGRVCSLILHYKCRDAIEAIGQLPGPPGSTST